MLVEKNFQFTRGFAKFGMSCYIVLNQDVMRFDLSSASPDLKEAYFIYPKNMKVL